MGTCKLMTTKKGINAGTKPDPDGPWPEGLHTLSMRGGRAVIDAKRRRWHPLAWLSKVLWRLRGAHPARLMETV